MSKPRWTHKKHGAGVESYALELDETQYTRLVDYLEENGWDLEDSTMDTDGNAAVFTRSGGRVGLYEKQEQGKYLVVHEAEHKTKVRASIMKGVRPKPKPRIKRYCPTCGNEGGESGFCEAHE